MADGDFAYQDLGHEEAVDEALVYQDTLAKLQAKLAEKGLTVSMESWQHPTTVPKVSGLAAMMQKFNAGATAAGISLQKLATALDVPVSVISPPKPDCTCGTSVETYDGPDHECPTHGQCASTGHEPGPDGGCHCGAVPEPEVGKVLQGPDGVTQMWDGEKWVLAVDPAPPKAEPLKGPLATFFLPKDATVHFLHNPGDVVASALISENGSGLGMEISHADGWNAPDADPVGDVQKAAKWFKEHKTTSFSYNAGVLSSEMMKLLYGFDPAEEPVHQSFPEVSTATGGAKFPTGPVSTAETVYWLDQLADAQAASEPEELPALFQPELTPAAQVVSSGMFCTACNEHWNEHQGDPVACDSGGYVRPALPHEEKAWRLRQQQKALGS